MYYQKCKPKKAHILICYRNLKAANPHCSHVGLGINARHTTIVLRGNRIRVDMLAVCGADDIRRALNHQRFRDVTHCIIEAPFIAAELLMALMRDFPQVQFLVRCHSNVGFLQVEAQAINLIRQYLILQDTELNFEFAANSQRLADFIRQAYSGRCIYLPNLYDLKRTVRKPQPFGNMHEVRIASFGAVRLMKNHTTAAAAALMLARQERLNLKFFLNVNREEHGKGVVQSLRNMFQGLHWAEMIEVPWQSWGEFRRVVGHMDLCYQLSMSETFNLVSADAIAEGIPVAGSDAIEWLPSESVCRIDDVAHACSVGKQVLYDSQASQRQLDKLASYGDSAVQAWMRYLEGQTN